MSFDLGVWHSALPLTNAEASEIYLRLCEDGPFLEGNSPDVAAFYDELTARWPEIDTVPEDKIGDFDYSPWSGGLDSSGMSVVMNCVWPKAADVATFVASLAEKHHLVLYDPQADKVYLPAHLQQHKPGFFARLLGKKGK